MDILLGWDATAGVIDDWTYRRFAEDVAFNPAMQAWMRQVNPHPLLNIAGTLLEASARSLWQADQQTLDRLRRVYLDVEGKIEEIREEAASAFPPEAVSFPLTIVGVCSRNKKIIHPGHEGYKWDIPFAYVRASVIWG